MSDGYVIENGDIKLTLSDADLEDILEDVKDCRDLLEPQIRLIGNTLVFRDQDIKLIDPVTFFVKSPPKFKLKKKHQIQGVVLCAFWMVYLMLLSMNHGMFIMLINSTVGIFMGMIVYGALRKHLYIIELERHRKALYVKAKLLSFFYMVIIQELTTTSERLERSNHRISNDHIELKTMYKRVYLSLPHEIRLDVPNRFPDGEEIHSEKRNYS